ARLDVEPLGAQQVDVPLRRPILTPRRLGEVPDRRVPLGQVVAMFVEPAPRRRLDVVGHDACTAGETGEAMWSRPRYPITQTIDSRLIPPRNAATQTNPDAPTPYSAVAITGDRPEPSTPETW